MDYTDLISFILGNITGASLLVVMAGLALNPKTEEKEVKRPIGFHQR